MWSEGYNNNKITDYKRKERYACTLKGMKMKFKRSLPKDLLTISNVYAPHTQRLQEELTELVREDELYTLPIIVML